MDKSHHLKLISFNCKGLKRSNECVKALCDSADVIALQETWLLPYEIPLLGEIQKEFMYTGKSSIDLSIGLLKGRPFGGVAVLWRKSSFTAVSVVSCKSDRLCAVKAVFENREVLIFSAYMPTNSVDNIIEFNDCLSEIVAIIETCGIELVYMLGDFNAHPGELFGRELFNFCMEQKWLCADVFKLGRDSNTYTFVSDAHGCRRWLDHCLTTEAAWKSVNNIKVLYDVYWSDHFPLEINCDLTISRVKSNIILTSNADKVKWGAGTQINTYRELCNSCLKNVDFPLPLKSCCDGICNDNNHRLVIDDFYHLVVQTLRDAAIESNRPGRVGSGKRVVGWNRYVKEAHRDAREKFKKWKALGMPSHGSVFQDMKNSKKRFKNKLKFCKNNKEQIQMNVLVELYKQKNFKEFWKETKKSIPRAGVPLSVDGETDAERIANIFREHFKVCSPFTQSRRASDDKNMTFAPDSTLSFSANEVKSVIQSFARGRAPGHDGLSVEHLVYAGSHIYRILAMFYTFCIRHTYLPKDLMESVVVPVVKNKTGDIADKCNYRPISLAAILGKVFDGLLERQLNNYLILNDAQFGFRKGLSTESAILALKQTVKYYTDRRTPVYAAFLDLSKAFDLVCYDKLWAKLVNLNVPLEIVNILKFWYSSQTNRVKWAGVYSESFRLECGVRQGGLTSPALFNVYINHLIDELCKTKIGCSIDGTIINNLSYADDMVLLSPSISALRKLIKICESYAAIHGLLYNVKKSELLIFKRRGISEENSLPVHLNGAVLKRVTEFKYLGHIVTEDLSDTKDIERERRALAVRCNMIARRFARCSTEVKRSLFKAYCQTFYTCSLWVIYTRRAYNDLRIQYNNGFRLLMGHPRFCSASLMFAEAHTDDFYAIIRKRAASMRSRIRGCANSILKVLADKFDSQFMKHWVKLHIHPQCFKHSK